MHMKSFTDILLESKKTYEFKIGVAGDCPDDCVDKLETALKKFMILSATIPFLTRRSFLITKRPTHKRKRQKAVKDDPYFNALQVKFGYAITCHKSQGGQWDTVFVEQPYLPNGIDRDYLRWLYTAITRAKEKLYLIGFKDDFFED